MGKHSILSSTLSSTLVCFILITVNSTLAETNYADDQSCKTCHQAIYQHYAKSGHPYKIQKISGRAPIYPAGTSPGVPNPPKGMTWQDISYVIGGYGWKARFMDKQGYILTGNKDRQYNLANPHLGTQAGWSGYAAKSAPKKPYTCGHCHTTGWQATGEQGPYQDNLPGIHGIWAQAGVTCEACHGPAADHASNPLQYKPQLKENCSGCHKRDEIRKIDASKGYIRHHEQAETLLASPHNSLNCISCHDPHKSTRYQLGGFKGTQNTCLKCHKKQRVKLNTRAHDAECTSCHMPRIVKSAIGRTHITDKGEISEGDIPSHIFAITTDPKWKMFDDKGKYVRVNKKHRAFLTLDRSCLTCHQDKDLTWARKMAKKVH